jgi:hypothetical protein
MAFFCAILPHILVVLEDQKLIGWEEERKLQRTEYHGVRTNAFPNGNADTMTA